MGEFSKHVSTTNVNLARAPHHMQVYTSTAAFPLVTSSTQWHTHESSNEHVHNYSSNAAAYTHEDDYYSSFETTLDRVLEMTQLGKEQSVIWENVVRAAYKTTEYHLEEETVCHVCGGETELVDKLCRTCSSSNNADSRAP